MSAFLLIWCDCQPRLSVPPTHLAPKQTFCFPLSHMCEPTWLRSPHVTCVGDEVIRSVKPPLLGIRQRGWFCPSQLSLVRSDRPLQMASQALSTGQVAEQGRVLWHGVTTETPRQLPEKRRGGLQAWEGYCQSFSSPLNRLLQLGGCQTLRF